MSFIVKKHEPRGKLKMTPGYSNTFLTHATMYNVNVNLQRSSCPFGNMAEGIKYVSGKHKIYGYKAEISVLPQGHFIICTTYPFWSFFDQNLFCKKLQLFCRGLKEKLKAIWIVLVMFCYNKWFQIFDPFKLIMSSKEQLSCVK